MQDSPQLSRNQHHALRRLNVALFSISFLISHSPSLTAPLNHLLAILRHWDTLNFMLLLTSLLFFFLLMINMGWSNGNYDHPQDDIRLTENGTTTSIAPSSASSSENNRNPGEARKSEIDLIQSKKGVVIAEDNPSALSQSWKDVRMKQENLRKSPDHRRRHYYCMDDSFQRGSRRSNNELYYFDNRSNRRHRRASSLDWNCQGQPPSLQGLPPPRIMEISSANGSTRAVYNNSDAYFGQQEATSMPTPSPGSDSSVNKKAEAFIKQFREQLRFEQAQSFQRRNNIMR